MCVDKHGGQLLLCQRVGNLESLAKVYDLDAVCARLHAPLELLALVAAVLQQQHGMQRARAGVSHMGMSRRLAAKLQGIFLPMLTVWARVGNKKPVT